MCDCLEAEIGQLLLGVAKHVAKRLVRAEPPPIEADKGHSVRRIHESIREALLALAQRTLGLGPLGDVAYHSQNGLPAIELDEDRHDFGGNLSPIGRDEANV